MAENRFYKRNFTLGIITGTFINIGMAFIDPFTVMPVFIYKLGGSAALVGLVAALHGVGWFLPQLFASRLVETRRYVMGMFRALAVGRILALAAMVFAVFWIDASQFGTLVAAFVGLLFLAHLLGGIAAVPILEIIGKTIPVSVRGRFFAWRRLIGGVIGIVAGMVVGLVLDEKSERVWMSGPVFDWLASVVGRLGMLGRTFPDDYGIVFLLGWIALSAGMITFCFAGEPPAASVKPPTSFLTTLKAGMRLLRDDRTYRQFYWIRICWQFTSMAFPFYASYAYTQAGFSENTVGLFLSVWVGSGVFSNYIWGKLLDVRGNRIVLLITALFSIIPPAVIIALDSVGATATGGVGVLLAIVSTFFVNGFIRSGRIISNITYLLEYAPEEKRPLYIGFMNSFSFPFMLSPLLAGLILQVTSYRLLFGLSLLFAIVNVVLTLRLEETRDNPSDPTKMSD